MILHETWDIYRVIYSFIIILMFLLDSIVAFNEQKKNVCKSAAVIIYYD